MNRYGQIALEHHRRHRPNEHARVPDPEKFFTEIGEEIQAQITVRRDEILGQPRPGETPEDYRLRSYQALATAEELTLSDHYLFHPEENPDTDRDDPILSQYAADLDSINRTLHASSLH